MRIAATVFLSCALLALACGGDDGGPTDPNPNPEPDLGHIQVSTTTSGADLDPDGYTVAMPGAAGRPIGLNGVTTFSDVEVGTHQVELSGLADNCSANGSNPATAAVTKDATAQVAFDIACEALPIGSVEVTTTVINNFDPDGYQVFVGGALVGRVDVNGTASFEALAAGTHDIELREIAPNCAVDGDNPATVDIPAGGSASYGFSVACTNPPDGRILVFYNGLTVMNADGSGRFLLAPLLGSTIEWGVWSVDGEKIAFSSNANTGDGHDIYVMNKDGSERVQLTTDPAHDLNPAFSPDGASIAFVSLRTGHDEIFVMASDGTGITQLTSDPLLTSANPSWSPDGTRIAFNQAEDSGMNADFAISVMDADGSNVTRLNEVAPICDQGSNAGFPAWWDLSPQWSPDGARILFHRQFNCTGDPVTDEPDIFVMDADGSNVTNLTNSPGNEGSPRWSPDGTRIVFTANYDGVYVMNADGSGVTQIAADNAGGFHELPDWGP
ncbi:MAG: hypothetical protein M8861_10290 [marine benthic group bacterium]|nr:hypothetical protein [Gemmatimonadota bacterium]